MVELADGATAFLVRDRASWHIAAGRREAAGGLGAWSASYGAFSAGFPGSITIRQDLTDGGSYAALTLQVSQLETNVPIDDRAFDVAVPADAQPLTLADLRRWGPLADRGSGR